MKTYYKTLNELLQDLLDNYAIVNMGIITGGIKYGEYRKFSFELSNEKKKLLQVQVYRLESGTYELNHYVL